jgi:arylsulfatase A-like enzyme
MNRTVPTLCCLLALATGCFEPEQPSPPSVILISLDTMRADRLGAYGHPGGLTPNLDRFAQQAVVFDRAYSQANETIYSHASLFTSRYPSELAPVDKAFALPGDVPTLAEVLAIHGYATAAVVGGGYMAPGLGLEQGFDTYRTTVDWGSLFHSVPPALALLDSMPEDQPFLLLLHSYDMHNRYLKPSPFGFVTADPGYDGVAARAVQHPAGTTRMVHGFLHSRQRFMGIWPEDTLRPGAEDAVQAIQRQAEQRRSEPYDQADVQHVRDIYDGAASYADAWFGLFMAGLEERGLLDEAMVIVIADHGEELGERGVFHHRHSLSEQTLRVPLMVRLPGGTGGGRHIDGRAALLDVMPTLLDYAGAGPAAGMQGISLRPSLEGAEQELHGTLYAECSWQQIAAHSDAGGLVFSGISAHSPMLVPLLDSARADGPAYGPWPASSPEETARLRAQLLSWRRSLPPTPDAHTELSPERLRVLQDQGYW